MGKKSIFDYFEVFIFYCIIWRLVDGMTLFDLVCFMWSVLSSKIIFFTSTEFKIFMFSYFCTVSDISKLINAEFKRFLKIPLVSLQFGNIKQVSNILFKSLLKQL